jgi:hypothetical protein
MKKFLIAAAIIFLSTGTYNSFAQGKFSATVTNTSNVLTFSLKPDVTTSTGFSDIEFFLASPTSSPAFSWGTVTANTTNFPGMTATSVLNSGSWEIVRNDFPITGYNVDHFIYTGPAPATTVASYTGGVEYQLITVPLLGNPPALVNFTLLDVEPSEYVYYSVTDQNGGDLRPTSLTNYFYPTTLTTAASNYPGVGDNTNTVYYLSLLNVPVPVKFTGFSVTKKSDDALLTWSVVNENTAGTSYEVERSLNGVDFTGIASVPVKDNSTGSNTYSYSDDNLSLLASTGTIYYRIEQVDKTGNPVYTEIKAVNLESGVSVSAYPNPTKDNILITVNLSSASNVSLDLSDANGKNLQRLVLEGVKGVNQSQFNLSGYAAGSYLLKVNSGTDVTTLPIVKQ